MFWRKRPKYNDYSFFRSLKEEMVGRSVLFRKNFIRFVVLVIFASAPWAITQLQDYTRMHKHEVILEGLTTKEKWERVQNGLARIECRDDTAELIRNHGFDPASSQGLNFALDQGLCNFMATEYYTDPQQICQDRGSWLQGECLPDFLPDLGNKHEH